MTSKPSARQIALREAELRRARANIKNMERDLEKTLTHIETLDELIEVATSDSTSEALHIYTEELRRQADQLNLTLSLERAKERQLRADLNGTGDNLEDAGAITRPSGPNNIHLLGVEITRPTAVDFTRPAAFAQTTHNNLRAAGSTSPRTATLQMETVFNRRSIALFYLFMITLFEGITTLVEPRLGLFLHGGLLIALFVHMSVTPYANVHNLLLALTFAPLIRLVSLSLPLSEYARVHWYIITGIPLIAAALFAMYSINYSRREVGLNFGNPFIELFVALTGIAFGYTEYQILAPELLVEQKTFSQMAMAFLILLIGTGFAEEFIFRGLIQRAAINVLGEMPGIVYSAVIFAVLHMGYQSISDVVFVFAVGLCFGVIVSRTNSIFGVTLAHGITNSMLFLVMPPGGA